MNHRKRRSGLLAASVDLRKHEAEDGTIYWSIIVGQEAIHIVRAANGFVATSMHGQRIGSTRTLAAAAFRATASLLRIA